MWYAIWMEGTTHESQSKRLQTRPAHLQRLTELQREARLLVAGPLPAIDKTDPGEAGFHGCLMIARFDSLQEAQTWAETDPYWTHGVYTRLVVKPFNKTFPDDTH
jgi:uncharacterized protein YciI